MVRPVLGALPSLHATDGRVKVIPSIGGLVPAPHLLAPTATDAVLRLMARLLPGPGGAGDEAAPTCAVDAPLADSPLTASGRRTGVELRQHLEQPPPGP